MKYRTIVADPPWAYPEGFASGVSTGRSVNARRDGDKARLGSFQQVGLPYQGMALDAIKALPVLELAARDCRLFLWTTNRWLGSAFGVLDAWGFGYRQTLVWHKTDFRPFGGSITPNIVEFVLVGCRGKPRRQDSFPSQVFKFPAVRRHSTKPAAFMDCVEQVSPGPYLELFARRQRLGWDTWGDEALSHVVLTQDTSTEVAS